tara:strand:- start:331 stop:1716 length:1386 start_codon:yes stop_codon:yes gene_type:complete
MKKNIYVLDTNVLVHEPDSILKFKNCNIVISLPVLKELDRLKTKQSLVGKNCRSVIRLLDGASKSGDVFNGTMLRNNSTLTVMQVTRADIKLLPRELNDTSEMDNLIIALMLKLQKLHTKIKITLITKDISLRLLCQSLQLNAEDFTLGADEATSGLYGGVSRLAITQNRIDKFYSENNLDVAKLDSGASKLQPNEYVVMKVSADSQSAIGKYCEKSHTIKPIINYRKIWNIQSKNKEQSFALDLLMDRNIQLASLIGPAGTGKTLLALAAGVEQIVSEKFYKKLIVIKPIQSVGNDIGYLPGTLEEKLEPWTAPIKDNFNVLFASDNAYTKNNYKSSKGFKNTKTKINNTYLDMLMEDGIIEIEAISFIRGRSIPNAYIIIDEAQNLSMHELKTIITRAGENTKIVLTGDVEQIDNEDVDSYTNGLSYAVDKFKGYNLAGHVTLIKGVRSMLATLASKIL